MISIMSLLTAIYGNYNNKFTYKNVIATVASSVSILVFRDNKPIRLLFSVLLKGLVVFVVGVHARRNVAEKNGEIYRH